MNEKTQLRIILLIVIAVLIALICVQKELNKQIEHLSEEEIILLET